MKIRNYKVTLFFYILVMLQNSLSSMTVEQVPTLKRLAATAYWKKNQMPAKQKINDEVEMLLITYKPLNNSIATEQLKNASFINDHLRIKECKEFISENVVKENNFKIIYRGFKRGVSAVGTANSINDFFKSKQNRIDEIANLANIRSDELRVNIYEESEVQHLVDGYELGVSCRSWLRGAMAGLLCYSAYYLFGSQ